MALIPSEEGSSDAFLAFASQVRDRLGGRLPGRDAQAQMSPRGRPGRKELKEMSCREASVLALLHPSTDGPGVVLIERPSHLKKHPGQIAFPGGRREEGESRLEAALRETAEEIGVAATTVEVLGGLTPLYIPPSNFCVYPYVGWISDLPPMVLDPGEVASAFSQPLRLFVDGPRELVELRTLGRAVPAWRINGHTVWGATAMMLSELAAVVEPLLPRG